MPELVSHAGSSGLECRPEVHFSALLECDANTRAFEVKKDRLQLRVFRDRLQISRIGHPGSHIVCDHQASRTEKRQKLVQVVDVTFFVRIEKDDITLVLQLFDLLMRVAGRVAVRCDLDNLLRNQLLTSAFGRLAGF